MRFMTARNERGGRGGRVIPIRGWKIRFDAPPAGWLRRRAEKGDLLALFLLLGVGCRHASLEADQRAASAC